MSSATINQLISDVLEQIFNNLNAEDLKNCTLVCKSWNDEIGIKASLMKKFKIRLFGSAIEPQFGHSSNRTHQNMHIEIDRPSAQLPDTIEKFSISQVKTLSIAFMSDTNTKNIKKLLAKVPRLQALTILFYEDCTTEETTNTPTIKLRELRSLRIIMATSSRLSSLNTSRLRTSLN